MFSLERVSVVRHRNKTKGVRDMYLYIHHLVYYITNIRSSCSVFFYGFKINVDKPPTQVTRSKCIYLVPIGYLIK